MEHNKKSRWFKFFYLYKGAFAELSGRNAKKLIIAIIDYAECGKIPTLNKKTMEKFEYIRACYDLDRSLAKVNGKKGANNRWNEQKIDTLYSKNGVSIKKNRVSMKKNGVSINGKY